MDIRDLKHKVHKLTGHEPFAYIDVMKPARLDRCIEGRFADNTEFTHHYGSWEGLWGWIRWTAEHVHPDRREKTGTYWDRKQINPLNCHIRAGESMRGRRKEVRNRRKAERRVNLVPTQTTPMRRDNVDGHNRRSKPDRRSQYQGKPLQRVDFDMPDRRIEEINLKDKYHEAQHKAIKEAMKEIDRLTGLPVMFGTAIHGALEGILTGLTPAFKIEPINWRDYFKEPEPEPEPEPERFCKDCEYYEPGKYANMYKRPDALSLETGDPAELYVDSERRGNSPDSAVVSDTHECCGPEAKHWTPITPKPSPIKPKKDPEPRPVAVPEPFMEAMKAVGTTLYTVENRKIWRACQNYLKDNPKPADPPPAIPDVFMELYWAEGQLCGKNLLYSEYSKCYEYLNKNNLPGVHKPKTP